MQKDVYSGVYAVLDIRRAVEPILVLDIHAASQRETCSSEVKSVMNEHECSWWRMRRVRRAGPVNWREAGTWNRIPRESRKGEARGVSGRNGGGCLAIGWRARRSEME